MWTHRVYSKWVVVCLVVATAHNVYADSRTLRVRPSKLTTKTRLQHAYPALQQSNPLNSLKKFLLSAPPEQLARDQHMLLRGAKINEILRAARANRLTEHDVATFSQSVNPRLLAVFEQGAGLPAGYFMATTRAIQFPHGNPFLAETPAEPIKRKIRRKLKQVVSLYRKEGGQGFPAAVQFLTGTAHLVLPQNRAHDADAVAAAVDAIPLQELMPRQAYIDRFSAQKILAQIPSRRALARRKGLVNFDHLLSYLGKEHKGNLLIEIYSENVPHRAKIARYVPVTALGEGSYCVDDIARTTVALLQASDLAPKKKRAARQKALAGLHFVEMMQAKSGKHKGEFYNFASIVNNKLHVNKKGSTSRLGIDFWAARSIWALGAGYAAVAASEPKVAAGYERTILRTLKRLEEAVGKQYGKFRVVQGHRLPKWLINDGADVTSVMLKGLLAYARALPPGKKRVRVERLIMRYADGIAHAQVTDPSAPDYGRHLHVMTDPGTRHLWGSRQVEVLTEASELLKRSNPQKAAKYLASARLSADHYFGKSTPKGLVSTGEEEIAYGVECVVSGFARLYGATKQKSYSEQTFKWSSWLFGKNPAKAVMYDPLSGRGYDGIRHIKEDGHTWYSVNNNSGAESTVEAILALQSARLVPGIHARLRRQLKKMLPR